MEKLGLSPPPSQRPHSLISHLYFPDVTPHGRRGPQRSGCPEFRIKLPPKLLITNGDCSSFGCVLKGAPLVLWLYNRLNVEDSVSYSLKHDGPLCCVSVNNVGPGPKGSYTCKNVISARDAESGTVMKGWHLHAFDPSVILGCGPPLIHPHSRDTAGLTTDLHVLLH